jgi:hypothetical protein
MSCQSVRGAVSALCPLLHVQHRSPPPHPEANCKVYMQYLLGADALQACAAVANEFFGTPEKGATCGASQFT